MGRFWKRCTSCHLTSFPGNPLRLVYAQLRKGFPYQKNCLLSIKPHTSLTFITPANIAPSGSVISPLLFNIASFGTSKLHDFSRYTKTHVCTPEARTSPSPRPHSMPPSTTQLPFKVSPSVEFWHFDPLNHYIIPQPSFLHIY